MAVYITEAERDNLLAVRDFVEANSDGAENYEEFEQMQVLLMSLFRKAKKDKENQSAKRAVKKYLKGLTKP
jgi:cell fate (sporulation/competence/biofilm development) regulator YlbF (YheA/YmcA/DUF963 family)